MELAYSVEYSFQIRGQPNKNSVFRGTTSFSSNKIKNLISRRTRER